MNSKDPSIENRRKVSVSTESNEGNEVFFLKAALHTLFVPFVALCGTPHKLTSVRI